MTLTEILQSPLTNLPITQKETISFRSGLQEVLNDYVERVQAATDTDPALSEGVAVLIKGILATLDHYYEGKPSDAFKCLSKCLQDSMTAGYLEKKGFVHAHTDLYRIRKMNSNYPLKKCNLFHIPFHQRGLVRTQRYSIPGLPTLYLSNSIYVAWEEMRRPDINEIQAVRLQNQKELRLLDLTTDDYNRGETTDANNQWDIIQKLRTWPLIAACSIKVRGDDNTFKPEYIIPQLLLQWINKNKLDGIKYSSTHINTAEKRHEAHFYNLVIPVKEFKKDEGYCGTLVGTFACTEVLPMQLRAFATVSHQFQGQSSPSTAVNPDVLTLELVRGQETMYWSTSFGVLEHALKGLKLGPILDG
jgi:hypothetical protein